MVNDYNLERVPAKLRSEVRRRIKAIEQHLNDPAAPAAKDIAENIGMELNRFYLLARIWKNGGRPEALLGANSKATPVYGSERRVITDSDLAFVAPENRADIRARIDAIQHFIHDENPPPAKSLAESIGLDVRTFRALVRIWLESGRPEALPGAGAIRKRRDAFTPEQSRIITRAIIECGNANVSQIYKHAVTLAEEEGVTLSVYASVVRKIRDIIGGRLRPKSWAAGCDILIDHCVIDVPVERIDGTTYMPFACILLDAQTGRPLAVRLTIDGPSVTATMQCLADAAAAVLEQRGEQKVNARSAVTLALPVFPGVEWYSLATAIESAGFTVKPRQLEKLGRVTAAVDLLGLRHEGIPIRPQMVTRSAEERTPSTKPKLPTLSLDAMQEFVSSRWLTGADDAGSMANCSNQTLEALIRLAADAQP